MAHAQSSTAALVTFSAGVASLAERDAAPRDIVARADEALYRAKQLGRNRSIAV
jgi:diguanylate cyclase (GGDEF)-like protein